MRVRNLRWEAGMKCGFEPVINTVIEEYDGGKDEK